MYRFLHVALFAVGVLSGLLWTVYPAEPQGQQASQQRLGTETGFGIFQQRCMSCHGNPAVERAPAPSALRQLTPEEIYDSLANGTMKIQGQSLTDEQKRRVAESLSARPLGSAQPGDASTMPNHCPNNPALSDPGTVSAWNGWGVDIANTRYQPAPGLTAAQVPKLRLKWAFGYPNGISAAGQPTIVSGRVFVGTDIGYVYSLDAVTGCVYWSFKTKASVRNAISVGLVRSKRAAHPRLAAYFGDAKANVYALDVRTGSLLWTTHVEEHFTARITGAPTLHDGRLYVPVSSFEEFSAGNLDYPCCTSRGSVVALDATTGRTLWKTYTIPEDPKPTRKNSKGTQLWAPAGASVWNSPTVDIKNRALYLGTGDSETEPAAKTSDAILALDLDNGKILWVFQATDNDSFLVDCGGDSPNRSENCPKHQGPDWDFGASPILRSLPGGGRVLVAAQKSGMVFGLDPDRQGALVWKVNLAEKPPGTSGLIVWGGAADEQNAYFGLTSGAMVALRLSTGERLWAAPVNFCISDESNLDASCPAAPSQVRQPHLPGPSAAVTAMPGVVLVGGWDGVLHALSTVDGRQIWQFNAAREFTTVNKVAARGGSFGAPGPVLAGGMLFVGSGYGVFGDDLPGNVLLAFGPE